MKLLYMYWKLIQWNFEFIYSGVGDEDQRKKIFKMLWSENHCWLCFILLFVHYLSSDWCDPWAFWYDYHIVMPPQFMRRLWPVLLKFPWVAHNTHYMGNLLYTWLFSPFYTWKQLRPVLISSRYSCVKRDINWDTGIAQS